MTFDEGSYTHHLHCRAMRTSMYLYLIRTGQNDAVYGKMIQSEESTNYFNLHEDVH